MTKLVGTAIAVCILIWSSSALAQVTYDGCTDALGRPVASILDTGLLDVANASEFNGLPIIRYNPYVLAWQAPQTRLFWYGHECGHHALGHVLTGLRKNQEQEADCFGIVTLVSEDILDIDTDLPIVQADLAKAGAGDWTHLPGPQRAINLRTCLQEAGLIDEIKGGEKVSVEQCISDKVEGCIDACTNDYGHDYNTCQSILCDPRVGANKQWKYECQP